MLLKDDWHDPRSSTVLWQCSSLRFCIFVHKEQSDDLTLDTDKARQIHNGGSKLCKESRKRPSPTTARLITARAVEWRNQYYGTSLTKWRRRKDFKSNTSCGLPKLLQQYTDNSSGRSQNNPKQHVKNCRPHWPRVHCSTVRKRLGNKEPTGRLYKTLLT